MASYSTNFHPLEQGFHFVNSFEFNVKLDLPVVPKVIEWMLRNDLDVGRLTTRLEVPKMRTRLEAGQPVVLGLIRVHTGQSPTENHQVLASGYDFDEETNLVTIHLYDPNHPGEEPSLLLNILQPSQGINISQSTGEALRAFFVINYKKLKPPSA